MFIRLCGDLLRSVLRWSLLACGGLYVYVFEIYTLACREGMWKGSCHHLSDGGNSGTPSRASYSCWHGFCHLCHLFGDSEGGRCCQRTPLPTYLSLGLLKILVFASFAWPWCLELPVSLVSRITAWRLHRRRGAGCSFPLRVVASGNCSLHLRSCGLGS